MIKSFKCSKPTIHENTWVDESAVVIGKVTISEKSSIWPNATLRGDVNNIDIGSYSNIQDGAVIHVTHSGSEFSEFGYATKIGSYVTVGHGAILHGCEIGDYSLVGMGAMVLDNAVIEPNVMIGAGSLVPPGKRLESGYLYVGSPVKQVRKLTKKEIRFFEFSAKHYYKLSQEHQKHSEEI